MSGILWIIIVGFVAGIIARLLSPGPNNPTGFILTTVLGIAGAFLATFVGQAIGHYEPDQGAGFITATIGALVVLFIWNRLVASGTELVMAGLVPAIHVFLAAPLSRRGCPAPIYAEASTGFFGARPP